ncbi:MAG: hypothetical protein LAQ30_05455 [Acidobacteriia bacterium]|nr:hypothetical protein [Terriglobia bacterium]
MGVSRADGSRDGEWRGRRFGLPGGRNSPRPASRDAGAGRRIACPTNRPEPPGLKATLTVLAILCCCPPLWPQADEPVAVFTGHPRLFLRPAKLKLLRRERERGSARWRQLEALIQGGAPMPEPGFAKALFYQVSGDAAAGRQAVAWALGPGADLRQMALVFDWCQDLLGASEKRDLAARLAGSLTAAGQETVAAMRSRALAAVALYDDVPDTPPRELRRIVRDWWEGRISPALEKGRAPLPRDDAYELMELLFAIRDNTNIDLRGTAPRAFKTFPLDRLMSYYPAAFQAPENDFRIGVEDQPAEPDVKLASLSRAADLALVEYDPNAAETQSLQGWLMHDGFILRGVFGAPYEFLWANPYPPGLSYYHLPLAWHDAQFGRLFARSSWDDDAAWFGYFNGIAQKFENGRPAVLNPRDAAVRLGAASVFLGRSARKLRLTVGQGEAVFLAGLQPRRTYQVEVDDEQVYEAATDPGGILELDLPRGKEIGVSIREAPIQPPIQAASAARDRSPAVPRHEPRNLPPH